MDKWIIIDPVLPPPRMNNPRYDRRRIFSHRRDRFSSKTLSSSWYLFRASLLVINSCVINESCTGKVQLPMQRWFPTPPFRPLFLFSFFNDPPVDLLLFFLLEEKNTREIDSWLKKKKIQVLNLDTLELEFSLLDDIIVIIVIIIVSGRKDIEILKICILFLNIVSLPLSLFRVEMDIPLWIVLASFLHRSINSRERYAYDDEV